MTIEEHVKQVYAMVRSIIAETETAGTDYGAPHVADMARKIGESVVAIENKMAVDRTVILSLTHRVWELENK